MMVDYSLGGKCGKQKEHRILLLTRTTTAKVAIGVLDLEAGNVGHTKVLEHGLGVGINLDEREI